MAHITRGMYYSGLDEISEWKKEIALINKERMGFELEPRILERVIVFLYGLIGGERLWIPRVLSSIFWITGGIFLYLMTRALCGVLASVVTLMFYLFLPFSVSASRSFQPDPMMMMLSIISVYGIIRYFKTSSWITLMITAMVSSLAIIIKPYSIFFIYGAFASLGIQKDGLRFLIGRDSVAFFLISIIPGASYYLSGILFGKGLIREHTQVTFLPHLLIRPYFYKDWTAMIGRVTGWIAFLIGIVSLIVVKKGYQRSLLFGLWAGYFIFGLLFTYHIHTHDYYQLFLIPIVSLSLGGVGHSLMENYKRSSWLILVILFLMAFVGYPFYKQGKDLKGANKYIAYLTGSNPYINSFFKEDYDRVIEMYKEIGEIVGHSKDTVFLTSDFGRSLTYHGELSGLPWPTSESLRERQEVNVPIPDKSEVFNTNYLTIRTHGRYIRYKPDYFIITDLKEFERQQDLMDFLNSNFPLIVAKEDFLIYDLRKMKGSTNG
ncbi:MAG: hypothetical protein Fur0020_01970 [Thermodesulfovibrionia bacterium]